MPALDASKTALLVIDVQHAFDLWEAAGRRRNNPDAAVRVADLLAAFRAAGAHIVHVRHCSTAVGSFFAPDHPGFTVKPEAKEAADEPVVVKRVNSAFIGTDLELRLRACGVQSVVICGATTNHCVETTTRMAGNLGFDTWLVSDATWTFDREGPDGSIHTAEAIAAMTMANLHDEFARITTTAAVVGLLSRRAAQTSGAQQP